MTARFDHSDRACQGASTRESMADFARESMADFAPASGAAFVPGKLTARVYCHRNTLPH